MWFLLFATITFKSFPDVGVEFNDSPKYVLFAWDPSLLIKSSSWAKSRASLSMPPTKSPPRAANNRNMLFNIIKGVRLIWKLQPHFRFKFNFFQNYLKYFINFLYFVQIGFADKFCIKRICKGKFWKWLNLEKNCWKKCLFSI